MDFTDVPTLGVSSSLALEKLILEDLSKGRDVFIVGACGSVKSRLEKLGVLDAIPPDHVLATRQDALEKATLETNHSD